MKFFIITMTAFFSIHSYAEWKPARANCILDSDYVYCAICNNSTYLYYECMMRVKDQTPGSHGEWTDSHKILEPATCIDVWLNAEDPEINPMTEAMAQAKCRLI